MDADLKQKFIQVMFRFKKSGMEFPKKQDVNMTELFVLAGIADNSFCDGQTVNLSEIQDRLHITKGAISQIFTSLEKRGYIVRETDKNNRRRITVVMTDEGKKTVADAREQVSQMLDKTLSRLGEEKAQQIISLLDELSDITEDVRSEFE